MLGIISAILITFKIATLYGILKDTIIDSTFYMIITGIIGARIYHIFLELPYYIANPLNTFKIWNGGLAIHGAFITGILTLLYLTKKQKIDFWLFTSLYAPGLALAQAIGRWGNYFNQELYGKPTNLPWGIPIEPANRIHEYYNFEYFHPTFIYESFGNLVISAILAFLHFKYVKNKKIAPYAVVLLYISLYSILRFSLEFIRIDSTPALFYLRWPQIISILLIIGSFLMFLKLRNKEKSDLK